MGGWVRSELPTSNTGGGMDWQQTLIDFASSGDKCWSHKGRSVNNANYVASTLRSRYAAMLRRRRSLPDITVTCRKDVVYMINNDVLEG